MAATVILGSGIIGVSTAYYLADHQPPDSIHLVDPASELFLSASGLAGGFLVKDWFSKSLAELGALSFEVHRKLAEQEGGKDKWGYSPSVAFRYDQRHGSATGALKRPGDLDWGTDGVERNSGLPPAWLRRTAQDELETIGDGNTAAQVDPRKLSRFLLQKCLDLGVQLHQPATALSVAADSHDELSLVRIGYQDSSTETEIPCARLVIAAGAWSKQVFNHLFGPNGVSPEVDGQAGYSIMIKEPDVGGGREAGQGEDEPCHALFCAGEEFTPYVFSRLGNEIYIGGLNPEGIPLPPVPTANPVIPEDVSRKLEETAAAYVTKATDKSSTTPHEVTRRSLCFRPVTPSGQPVLGRVPDDNLGSGMCTRPGARGGVFFAAGHGPWGISLSLGTGMVMSEMMQGRPMSAEITELGIKAA